MRRRIILLLALALFLVWETALADLKRGDRGDEVRELRERIGDPYSYGSLQYELREIGEAVEELAERIGDDDGSGSLSDGLREVRDTVDEIREALDA